MKRIKFAISTPHRRDGNRLVTGYIIGEFGIDERRRRQWVVTHIRTGALVGVRNTREKAVRFAEVLTRDGGRAWKRGTFGSSKGFPVNGRAYASIRTALSEVAA